MELCYTVHSTSEATRGKKYSSGAYVSGQIIHTREKRNIHVFVEKSHVRRTRTRFKKYKTLFHFIQPDLSTWEVGRTRE